MGTTLGGSREEISRNKNKILITRDIFLYVKNHVLSAHPQIIFYFFAKDITLFFFAK